MRRLFAWTAGLVSVAALAHLLSRRRRHAKPATPEVEDPVDGLRRRLAESRSEDTTPSSGPVPENGERALSLEERRARVHARAQAAIDAMRETPPGD